MSKEPNFFLIEDQDQVADLEDRRSQDCDLLMQADSYILISYEIDQKDLLISFAGWTIEQAIETLGQMAKALQECLEVSQRPVS